MNRNHCPVSVGIGVRYELEWVSGINRNTHRIVSHRIIDENKKISLYIPSGKDNDEVSIGQILLFGISRKLDDNKWSNEILEFAMKELDEGRKEIKENGN